MIREISPETLHEWIADRFGDPLVIDVRTEAEFCIGNIPESINIPMSQLTTEIGVLEGAERIVVVCEVGELSRKAARLVECFEGINSDATVVNLEGGYRKWAEFRSDEGEDSPRG